MNTLVKSHHHYPALLLLGISASLIVSSEKQKISWAIKTRCDRAKFNLSSNRKTVFLPSFTIFHISENFPFEKIVFFLKFFEQLGITERQLIEKRNSKTIKLNPRSKNCFY